MVKVTRAEIPALWRETNLLTNHAMRSDCSAKENQRGSKIAKQKEE